jgi:hypothetical protein
MRFVAIICAAVIALAGDVARAQPNRINSVRTPPSAALMEFWTEQRLREAPATPVRVIDPSKLGSADPAEPKSGAVRTGKTKALHTSVSGVSGNVQARPLVWAGKLYFNTPKGTSHCSAQFVAPGILSTAAHCIQDDTNGQWFTNFLYRHQYHRGRARDFPTECVAAYTAWVSRDEARYAWDYAMIKLRGGTDLGHFGTEWSWWGRHNSVPKIGYPQALESGEVIQVDFGRLIKGWHPNVVGLNHGNPQNAEGSSGGAWVGQWQTSGNSTQANFMISVTSHHMGDDRGTSFGPYWSDNHMVNLMNYARRGCR